jgi:hypothetical protein
MKIRGIEGMSADQLNFELQRGARFVIFQYTISVIVMTFRRASDVYFIRAGESTTSKSIGFTLLTVVTGWWGIPWGPIYSVQSLITNVRGGKNVTAQITAARANTQKVTTVASPKTAVG